MVSNGGLCIVADSVINLLLCLTLSVGNWNEIWHVKDLLQKFSLRDFIQNVVISLVIVMHYFEAGIYFLLKI